MPTNKKPSERFEEIMKERYGIQTKRRKSTRVILQILDECWEEEEQKKLAGTDSEHPHKSEWLRG